MERTPRPHRLFALLTLAALLLVAQSGCVSGLFTALYLIKGTDTPAEFTGLTDKKVVVVCRPVVELRYANGNAASAIAERLSELLGERVRKVTVIDPQKVAEWTDEHTWDEFPEVGRALGADIVIGIDLEHFSLLKAQTLYQGTAEAQVTVYDLSEGKAKIAFQKALPKVVYPPNAVIPVAERPEDQFFREYTGIVADQIGRLFYPHDKRKDWAQDTWVLD